MFNCSGLNRSSLGWRDGPIANVFELMYAEEGGQLVPLSVLHCPVTQQLEKTWWQISRLVVSHVSLRSWHLAWGRWLFLANSKEKWRVAKK